MAPRPTSGSPWRAFGASAETCTVHAVCTEIQCYLGAPMLPASEQCREVLQAQVSAISQGGLL